MLLPVATAFAAACLFTTPLLWPHPPALLLVTMLASAVAGASAVRSILDRRFRPGMIAAGALLALANFPFIDAGVPTVALHVATGFLFILAGLAPEVQITPAPMATIVPTARAADEEPHQPDQPERHAA